MLFWHANQIFPCPLKYYFWLFTASKFLFSLSRKWSFQVRYLLTFKKLSIHILKVSLILKLIIQITPTLIRGIFLNSIISTHLISQLTPVANKLISNYLLMKERKKYYIKYYTIPSKFFCFLECSSADWVKCTYAKLKEFLVCYKNFLVC